MNLKCDVTLAAGLPADATVGLTAAVLEEEQGRGQRSEVSSLTWDQQLNEPDSLASSRACARLASHFTKFIGTKQKFFISLVEFL